jgi:plastocyanin
MTYMIMNHRNAPDNALIKYTVTYETDPAGAGLTPVEPWWLDVRDCRADPIYNVPGAKNRKKAKKRKPKHVLSRDYTIPGGGRIVGGAGHVHGGAYRLTVTQPECGNREISASNPTWGKSDHPFYTVRPVLHEPGPINMSSFQSDAGLPVGAGGKIRLNSVYDNVYPHTRVMGIYLLFVAPPTPGTDSCDPLPGDVESFATDQPGRKGKPVPYTIPLTGLDRNGNAVTIRKPPGKLRRAKSGAQVNVEDRLFDKANVLLRQGAKLNYRFTGGELHNVTLANGPLGFGSDNLDGDRVFSQRFKRAGTYRLFCGLHPVQMSQRVVVQPKKKRKRGR